MKKILLSIAALMLIIGATLLTSCTKDDTTAPVITLTGSATVTVILNSTYTDAGATATDDKDGNLTSSIVVDNTVNANLKGTYTVTYTVSDAAGNTGTATRTVNVVNSAESFAGTYNVTDVVASTSYPYTDNITTSSTVNNRIWVTQFAAYTGAAVYMDVTTSSVNLPSQTCIQCGSPAADRLFSGAGSISGTTITVNYSETTNSTVTSGIETYVKQ